MTNRIVHQDGLDGELLDLTVEIFSTTFGLDWNGAVEQARALLPAMLAFALAWDRQAAAEALGDLPTAIAA